MPTLLVPSGSESSRSSSTGTAPETACCTAGAAAAGAAEAAATSAVLSRTLSTHTRSPETGVCSSSLDMRSISARVDAFDWPAAEACSIRHARCEL